MTLTPLAAREECAEAPLLAETAQNETVLACLLMSKIMVVIVPS